MTLTRVPQVRINGGAPTEISGVAKRGDTEAGEVGVRISRVRSIHSGLGELPNADSARKGVDGSVETIYALSKAMDLSFFHVS
jgi:hypothetical protein